MSRNLQLVGIVRDLGGPAYRKEARPGGRSVQVRDGNQVYDVEVRMDVHGLVMEVVDHALSNKKRSTSLGKGAIRVDVVNVRRA